MIIRRLTVKKGKVEKERHAWSRLACVSKRRTGQLLEYKGWTTSAAAWRAAVLGALGSSAGCGRAVLDGDTWPGGLVSRREICGGLRDAYQWTSWLRTIALWYEDGR